MFIYCRYKSVINLFGILLQTGHIRKVLVMKILIRFGFHIKPFLYDLPSMRKSVVNFDTNFMAILKGYELKLKLLGNV